jgi:hypothetical protein
MKIEFQLTIKCTPENEAELIDGFATGVRTVQTDLASMLANNVPIVLNPKDTVARVLVMCRPEPPAEASCE